MKKERVDLHLEKYYKDAQGMCNIMRSQAEQLKTSEVWSRGPLMEVEPLEILRGGELFGKHLNKSPSRTSNAYCYWLDSSGVIVARFWGSDIQGQFYEELFVREGDDIRSVTYGSSRAKLVINTKNRIMVNNDYGQ